MHLYFDTSDLNAPYDQYRGAAPLQGVGSAQHLYMDYSLLNAQYAEARPAIHGLGGGSLGGSAIGNIDGKLVGIGATPEMCSVWTGAHHRMRTGIAAQPDDVDLMAIWNRNTDQWGCPVRGEFHWFWPTAPTSAWNFRGPTDKFVKNDWDTISQSSTLYIPPFVTDMGKTFTPLGDQLSSRTPVPTPSNAPEDLNKVDPNQITPTMIFDLQRAMNTQLSAMGCRPISVDGRLGKETCGALAHIDRNADDLTAEMQDVMGPYIATIFTEMCSEFEYGCTSSTPVTTAPPTTTRLTNLPSRASFLPTTGNGWLIGGAVVTGLLLVTGAVIYKRGM